jgi:hypothetical protein
MDQLEKFSRPFSKNDSGQGHQLALIVLFVPDSLDSDHRCKPCARKRACLE